MAPILGNHVIIEKILLSSDTFFPGIIGIKDIQIRHQLQFLTALSIICLSELKFLSCLFFSATKKKEQKYNEANLVHTPQRTRPFSATGI